VEKMHVLFLGGVFDEDMEKNILKKTKNTVHYAANNLQWNLINGLLEINNLQLEIISAPLIGAFPKDYKSILCKRKQTMYKNTLCNYVGFNNLWGYRNISRKNNLINEIKGFALSKSQEKVILVYSPHTPFLQASIYAKKLDPSIHICLIVPDLPQFMNLNLKHSLIYDLLKKIDINLFERNLKYVDSFVLLTEQMKNILRVGEKPYIVIEGVVSNKFKFDNKNDSIYFNSNDLNVVYTGTLNSKFGIKNLIEAFHRVERIDAKLKICGRGDSEKFIKEFAIKDHRIIYMGQLSNKEAIELQLKATVLVNPRQNIEEFTKYSFPSKNLEYMMTGRPVIAYKLDGIPDEYDNYMIYVKDNSVESLTTIIEDVLSMDENERDRFGIKGKNFVLEEKNNVNSIKKIINMIQNNRSN